MHNGRRNGNVGRWLTAVLRTLNMCRYWHQLWMSAGPGGGDGNLSKLPDFMSCRYPPMDIFSEDDGDELILVKHPPCPLHLKLGIKCFSGLDSILLDSIFLFYYQASSTMHSNAWRTSILWLWTTSSMSTTMRREVLQEVVSLGRSDGLASA